MDEVFGSSGGSGVSGGMAVADEARQEAIYKRLGLLDFGSEKQPARSQDDKGYAEHRE